MDFEQHNQDVKEWTNRMTQMMRNTGAGMGIHHREGSPSPRPSLPGVKGGFKYDAGAIEVISFKFSRSLIYTQKGAGKGRGGNSGSSWVDQYGKPHKTNPKSMGKMGTSGRTAKPWFTQPMNGANGVELLADLVAKNIGGAVTENILNQ